MPLVGNSTPAQHTIPLQRHLLHNFLRSKPAFTVNSACTGSWQHTIPRTKYILRAF